jgi:hypothetical protein
MKHLRSVLLTALLPIVAVAIVVYGCHRINQTNKLCMHAYALCTSAMCIPQPGNPKQAICFCDVEQGPNMSTVSCDSLRPSTDKNGVQTVYSTFSFKQFKAGKKGLVCPNGTPWSWCLNKRCTVEPSNPKKAVCICDVMRTGKWTTLGGNCDPSTCNTGYWSGATLNDLQQANIFMTKALSLDESPVKWCEGDSQ